jgi:hypothetical protein
MLVSFGIRKLIFFPLVFCDEFVQFHLTNVGVYPTPRVQILLDEKLVLIKISSREIIPECRIEKKYII